MRHLRGDVGEGLALRIARGWFMHPVFTFVNYMCAVMTANDL